jgi:hypothetical protein
MRWEAAKVRWMTIESKELAALATSSQENDLLRILAANWLAEAFPKEAMSVVAKAASGLSNGPMLGCLLELAARLKVEELGPAAIRLMEDAKAPMVARLGAIDYLAAFCDAKAIAALEKATAAKDYNDVFDIDEAKYSALGQPGDAVAAQCLIRLLRNKDNKVYFRQEGLARALAKMADAEGIAFLKKATDRGESWGLSGLAECHSPSFFDYFLRRAKDPSEKNLSVVLLGLRNSDSKKALLVLLDFVKKHKETGKAASTYPPSPAPEAARQMAEIDGDKVVAALAPLARAGNHSALLGLANCRHPSARPVLEEIARKEKGDMRKQALEGLANHWAAESADTLLEILRTNVKEERDSRDLAMRGLSKIGDARAIPRVLELAKSKELSDYLYAGELLKHFPLGPHLPKVFDAFLQTDSKYLADALIQNGWNDAAALPKLREHLLAKAKSKEADLFPTMILIRALTGSTMGPDRWLEYSVSREKWNEKWAAWCRQQH